MSPRRPKAPQPPSAAGAVRLDVEPRRSRAALGAALGAAVLLLALLLVPLILRSTMGATSDAASAGILLLALAAVLIGAVLFVLAVIGLVRSHGTPRVGALLLVIDGAVQLGYGLAGNSTLMVDALRDSLLLWSWAVLSILLTVLGCVFVLATPRPVLTARRYRRRSDER
ncbi:hypothetical protein [Propionibacterium australiense]|uniref:Uncharacterized protein n=1 Tax=Propionibacterium australiense TaxID=119981 RepID=A0A383S3K1_9ACTN|nr:hypothetical protein [Propionibacterium australiense]RLP11951.1 hypothetical protein D7U36_03555 [Propionibacterium australiense]RLP12589.1 hypothetical protein D9T14_01740 [Propionibacterium australiense]SYZ32585.1 Hypothetical protein PROPAUS_0470 [Propionibacterium australiense]VEH91664.1 Uncharacterised protein [Propionibacterium australiense]